MIKYELRQQVETVDKKWLVVILTSEHERSVMMHYEKLINEYRNVYFEVVKIETIETCLAHTNNIE